MSIKTRQLRTYLKITEKFIATIDFDKKDYEEKLKTGKVKANADTEKFFKEAKQRATTLIGSLNELIQENEIKEAED